MWPFSQTDRNPPTAIKQSLFCVFPSLSSRSSDWETEQKREQEINGKLREVGEGRGRDLWKGLQSEREVDGQDCRPQEDASSWGRGRCSSNNPSGGLSFENALYRSTRREVFVFFLFRFRSLGFFDSCCRLWILWCLLIWICLLAVWLGVFLMGFWFCSFWCLFMWVWLLTVWFWGSVTVGFELLLLLGWCSCGYGFLLSDLGVWFVASFGFSFSCGYGFWVLTVWLEFNLDGLSFFFFFFVSATILGFFLLVLLLWV